MTDIFSKQIAIEIENGRKLAKVPACFVKELHDEYGPDAA